VVKIALDLVRRVVVIVNVSIPRGTDDVAQRDYATFSSILISERTGRCRSIIGTFVIAEVVIEDHGYTTWHTGTRYEDELV